MAASAWMEDSDSKQNYVAQLVFYGLRALFSNVPCFAGWINIRCKVQIKKPENEQFSMESNCDCCLS